MAADYHAFLKKFPNGSLAAQARARMNTIGDPVWNELKNSKDPFKFRDYIKAHPDSPFIDQAKARFEVLARRGDDLDVTVTCSSGTYVRALARDLGAALGCGGHLTALRRTRVGPFDLTHAAPLEPWDDARVIGLDRAVCSCFPARELTEDEATALSYGKRLSPEPGLVGAFDPQGRCVALVEDGRPTVVFRPAGG